MDELDTTGIIYTIRDYENSIEMPDSERVTFVDSEKHVHLINGDYNARDFAIYANKCLEYLRFGDEVDCVTAGEGNRYTTVKLCDTPEILLKAGLKQEPMLYTQRHLLDAIHPKSEENYHWHGLTIPQIKRFPELLEHPVMLSDSPSRSDCLLAVLCDVDSDRLPIIMAIKPNGHGFYQLDEIETNFILSVYGKEDFELYFEERITPERLVYFNKEKGRELERLAGIQFPGNYFNFDPNTIIRYPHCIDKNKVPVQEPKIISNCELSSKAVEASKAANALKNRTANQCNHIEQNR